MWELQVCNVTPLWQENKFRWHSRHFAPFQECVMCTEKGQNIFFIYFAMFAKVLHIYCHVKIRNGFQGGFCRSCAPRANSLKCDPASNPARLPSKRVKKFLAPMTSIYSVHVLAFGLKSKTESQK